MILTKKKKNEQIAQYSYIAIIVLAQLVILFVTKSSMLPAISSLAGALYVSALTFKKKFAFLAAMVFNATMLFVGWQHGILSEIIQQPMFFLMDILGLVQMNRPGKYPVIDKVLTRFKTIRAYKVFLLSFVFIVVWTIISFNLGSPIWQKDGLLGGIAIAAQVFAIAENKYSWFGWMALNGMTAFTWLTMSPANGTMGALYIIFFVNSIVGFIFWKMSEKKEAKKLVVNM